MEYAYKVSAVICSYNRARFIINAVESIFNQVFDKNLFEVIVVDNNSTDNTIALLAQYKTEHPQYNFRFFVEKNQGVAFTRSRCAKESLGEIVAYIDDDCIALPGWLPGIATFFDTHPKAYSIGGKISPNLLAPLPDWYSKYFANMIGTLDLGPNIKRLTGIRYPCGANMAFRKKVFEELGYFNSELGRKGTGLLATEEKDIYFRILKQNYEVYYLPHVSVLHNSEATKFDFNYVKRHSMGIGGGERLLLKGQTQKLIIKFLEYFAKWGYSVVFGIGFLLKGQWSKFYMFERFRWWVIMGFLDPDKAK